MAAGTETEHARSMSHCVLHLFLNSKQRTKLETVNSDSIYFRSSVMPVSETSDMRTQYSAIFAKAW